jgi:GDP-4-dehydro-6-deoxy-D-mannose reductase
MKVLVTGASGFAASHLIERLLSSGHEVVGTTRIRSNKDNIAHLKIPLISMELHDPFGVSHVIETVKPEAIFHLAAQSFVGWSWNHPEETMKTNVMGTLYVLEAVRKHCPKARVHIASSSQVYGNIKSDEQPMGHKTGFNPMNPYDTSKLAQDMLALQYFNSYGLNIIRTRAFNISGPRRGECFAESSWAKQIAEIEKGAEPVIKHGNLESSRDYIDVRDVVEGYEKACFHGVPGKLYILGSGVARSMFDVMNVLVSFSSKPITPQVDESRMRPSDTPYMQADTSDMEFLLGHRLIPFSQSMEDLINYWRAKV